MKNEFIWNEHKTGLINIAHITTMSISAPCLEQKDYLVVCSIAGQGSQILLRGTLEECNAFLTDFHYYH